jgi:hypothetical protein
MRFSRRSILKTSALLSAAAALPSWFIEPLLAATPLTRHDVNGTSADARAAVAAYRKGVEVMKQRPAHDPTSWIFQANIHSWPGQFRRTADDPEQEFREVFSPQNTQGLPAAEKSRREQLARKLWGTCTHGDPQERFLPWHRVYLFFFERIVRAAGGLDASSPLGLPYWNWTKDRTLPLPFREAVNGSQANNALFWNNRQSSVNRIANPALIRQSDVRVSTILDLPGFSPTFPPRPQQGFSNDLEDGPHGNVHVWVQIPPNGMGFFEQAARDPIFWLHHCNIDRLWMTWRSKPGHRDPEDAIVTPNMRWDALPQDFADADGQIRTLTTKQVLIAAAILDQGYTYDDMPIVVAAQPPTSESGPAAAAAPTPSPEPVARSGPLRVSNRTSVVLQPRQQPGSPAATATPQPIPVVLALKDIVAEGTTAPVYDVYLNLPEGEQPNPDGPYFAGTVNVFNAQAAGRTMAVPEGANRPSGHDAHLRVEKKIAVAELLQRQRDGGLWQGGPVNVTIVPSSPVEGGGGDGGATPAAPTTAGALQIGAMELIGR